MFGICLLWCFNWMLRKHATAATATIATTDIWIICRYAIILIPRKPFNLHPCMQTRGESVAIALALIGAFPVKEVREGEGQRNGTPQMHPHWTRLSLHCTGCSGACSCVSLVDLKSSHEERVFSRHVTGVILLS